MRTMSQKEALDRLPDGSMAKRAITTILNTPRPDFTQPNTDVDKYIAMSLALNMDAFVHKHVKPAHDESCICMCQIL